MNIFREGSVGHLWLMTCSQLSYWQSPLLRVCTSRNSFTKCFFASLVFLYSVLLFVDWMYSSNQVCHVVECCSQVSKSLPKSAQWNGGFISSRITPSSSRWYIIVGLVCHDSNIIVTPIRVVLTRSLTSLTNQPFIELRDISLSFLPLFCLPLPL